MPHGEEQCNDELCVWCNPDHPNNVSTLSSVPEENKYGVSKWLIEALKPYDSLLATGDKGKKMKAKRHLEALINQQIKGVLDELEGEAIGEDEKMFMDGKEVKYGEEVYVDFSGGITDQSFIDSAQFIETNAKNNLRREQRKAIQKIRSRYE